MTGFARADGAWADWMLAVEARSVNGRNLEVRFKGPPQLESLERLAREGGQARFSRGQINVSLQARRSEGAAGVRVNRGVLDQYLALARELAGEAAPPTVDGLLALRGVLEADEGEQSDEDRAALEAAAGAVLAQALDELRVARIAEGAALAVVLTGFIDRIAGLVADAEVGAATLPVQLKARFTERMTDLLGDGAVSEERVAQEAAALAVRADVREELDRLASHVTSARALLTGPGPVGRKLDFLGQEFLREVNTLCAKSGSVALTRIGLDLKAAVDQFREQISNVE